MYEEWELNDSEIEEVEAWVASNPRKVAVMIVLLKTVLNNQTSTEAFDRWIAGDVS